MASSRTAAQRRRALEIRQSQRPVTARAAAAGDGAGESDEEEYWEAEPAVGGARWPAYVGLLITLLGVADATYLTIAHYSSTNILACSDNGLVNCAKVTTSQYSRFLGLPVAVLGLAFFVAMIPLQLPRAWRSDHPYVRIGRMGACVIGVVMVLWLLYAELFLIGNICLYCTGVHILTFALFVATALGTIATSRRLA